MHHGSTLRRETPARERFKGMAQPLRPHIGFGRGEYLELVADGSILELSPRAPLGLSTWEVSGNGVVMTDLIAVLVRRGKSGTLHHRTCAEQSKRPRFRAPIGQRRFL